MAGGGLFLGKPTGVTRCVPLVAQGDPLSLLVLRRPADGLSLSLREDLEAGFAEYLALALASLRLRERLLAQSIRDSLTDLYNRRYLEVVLVLPGATLADTERRAEDLRLRVGRLTGSTRGERWSLRRRAGAGVELTP